MDYSCLSFFSKTALSSLFISFTYKNMRFIIGAETGYLKWLSLFSSVTSEESLAGG